MHIITKRKIQSYCKDYHPASKALMSWFHQVKVERWEQPPDIRLFANSVDFVGNNRVVFNINGNHYRLIVDVFYAFGKNDGTVLIRWFGSHKEYDALDVRSVI
jgi:mRNA interferase HigB